LSIDSYFCSFFGAEQRALYGINAYYLMIESYRQQNSKVDVRKTIIKYLHDDLGLAWLREKSKVNAIRFGLFTIIQQKLKE